MFANVTSRPIAKRRLHNLAGRLGLMFARLPRLLTLLVPLLLGLLLLASNASAHFEAVRVYWFFPTEQRATMALEMVSSASGAAIQGANLKLEVSDSRTKIKREIPFEERGPGKYSLPDLLAPGSYDLTLVDQTSPGEALRRSLAVRLPRPANQDTYTFTWPPTSASSAPAGSLAPLLLGLLALPLALAGALLLYQTWRRSRTQTDPAQAQPDPASSQAGSQAGSQPTKP
jgi:hypothetical protein